MGANMQIFNFIIKIKNALFLLQTHSVTFPMSLYDQVHVGVLHHFNEIYAPLEMLKNMIVVNLCRDTSSFISFIITLRTSSMRNQLKCTFMWLNFERHHEPS